MCPCEECIVKAMCTITSRNQKECPELQKWLDWQLMATFYEQNKDYYSKILLENFKNHTIFTGLYKAQKGESW